MVLRANVHAVEPEEIVAGDEVFVSAVVLPDPREMHLPKGLRSRFTGPYKVMEAGVGVAASNVRIELPQPPFRKRYREVNVGDVKVFRPLDAPRESDLLYTSLASAGVGVSTPEPIPAAHHEARPSPEDPDTAEAP